MAGDGVSLPTNIAQMGSVAKTQARTQQSAQATHQFADQLDKKDELKVQRVKETGKAEQQKINPDEEKAKDRRKRRRERRKEKFAAEKAAQEQDENGEESRMEGEGEQLGVLLDLRA